MDNSLSEILDAYQVTAKWTKARNACYGLFTAGNNGVENEYMDRMRVLQSAILSVQRKFMLTGIVPAVLEICKIEADPRMQMQFLAAGYELVAGNDFTTELYEFLAKQKGLKTVGQMQWNFWMNDIPCHGSVFVSPIAIDLKIRPMKSTDDIGGGGAGMSITKTFKR